MEKLNSLQEIQFNIITKYKNDLIMLQCMFDKHKHLRQMIKKITNKQITQITNLKTKTK